MQSRDIENQTSSREIMQKAAEAAMIEISAPTLCQPETQPDKVASNLLPGDWLIKVIRWDEKCYIG